MRSVLIVFITVYAVYNVIKTDDTLKKIERWLYLIALILFNILIQIL